MLEDRDHALGVRRWVHDINHFSWICNGEDIGKLLRYMGIFSEENERRVMAGVANELVDRLVGYLG